MRKLIASSLQCCICLHQQASSLLAPAADRWQSTVRAEQPVLVPLPAIVCSDCKMQRYCSLKHLNEDGDRHRDFCDALRKLQREQKLAHPLQLQGQEIGPHTRLQQTIAQLKMAVRVMMRRNPHPQEQELLGYPAYCVVCYALDSLQACGGCEAVAYCSEGHRFMDKDKHTPAVCRTLALIYSPYKVLEEDSRSITKLEEETRHKESHLIESFQRATKLVVDDRVWRSKKDYQSFANCSTFSGMASLCLALEHISFVIPPDQNTPRVCTVFIVGATDEQNTRYFREIHLRYFFLQCPQVYHLDLYFIGQQLKQDYAQQTLSFVEQARQRQVVKRFLKLNFKEFVSAHQVDPVLIMLYQPDFAGTDGFSEKLVQHLYPFAVQANSNSQDNDWEDSLKELLFIYNVPICYTSLSRMYARSDYAAIRMLALENDVIIRRAYPRITENPYREILPLRNACAEDEETVIYGNNYLEVIFTSLC